MNSSSKAVRFCGVVLTRVWAEREIGSRKRMVETRMFSGMSSKRIAELSRYDHDEGDQDSCSHDDLRISHLEHVVSNATAATQNPL